MDVRLRPLAPLLKARGLTAYQLAKRSGGRIAMSTAYRLTDDGVHEKRIDLDTLAALVDVLGVTRFDELFSRDDEAPPPAKPKRQRSK
jgi:transcriptional regulator with XRE-family HTH domain